MQVNLKLRGCLVCLKCFVLLGSHDSNNQQINIKQHNKEIPLIYLLSKSVTKWTAEGRFISKNMQVNKKLLGVHMYLILFHEVIHSFILAINICRATPPCQVLRIQQRRKQTSSAQRSYIPILGLVLKSPHKQQLELDHPTGRL